MDAIRDRGPEVSIDDIATQAGVSKPVLYGHFGDKLGLADAVAALLADSVLSVTMGTSAGGTSDTDEVDFPTAIGVIVGALVDLVEAEPEIYGFLVRTIRSGDRGFLDNALVEVIRIRGGRLAALAEPGIDPSVLAVLVDGAFGFLLFSVESWQASRSVPRDELVTTLVEAVVAGFGSARRPGRSA